MNGEAAAVAPKAKPMNAVKQFGLKSKVRSKNAELYFSNVIPLCYGHRLIGSRGKGLLGQFPN